jgi:hypothetical protein
MQPRSTSSALVQFEPFFAAHAPGQHVSRTSERMQEETVGGRSREAHGGRVLGGEREQQREREERGEGAAHRSPLNFPPHDAISARIHGA